MERIKRLTPDQLRRLKDIIRHDGSCPHWDPQLDAHNRKCIVDELNQGCLCVSGEDTLKIVNRLIKEHIKQLIKTWKELR